MADEDLLPSVRQLISKIEPTIRSASSVDEAEEMLLHLEETDENFHRYEFIKYLRNKIDTALSSLIDEEIEKKMVGGRGKGKEAEKIQSVTEAVVESPVYAELTQTLKQTTKDAIDRLLETFEEDVAKERKILEGRVSPKKTGFPFSDDSSFDSSFNQANFSFPNAEKFQMLANNLESCQPLEVRRDALKQLCQFPPADVLACDQWGKLKKGLGAALSDSDEQLEDRSLKFHAKMFSTNSHTITKEVYTSLVDHLATLFQSRKSKASITTSEGLNTSEQNVQRVLRKFRLMNEFQRQAPSYWIRFPEKFVDDVLESTLSLLAIHTASETMTPLHYLSLLDPQAMWFKMWMHSNYSRTAVIRIIKKHRNLIDTCVKFLMDFVSSRKMPQDIVSDVTEKLKKGKIGEDRRILFTAREVEYVYFVHCLGIVGVVLLYHNGRDLFPVKHRDKEVAVTDLLVALIQLLSDGGSQHMLKRAAVFDPGNLVRDVLKNLSASHAVCSACICKNKVITELISPIKSWLPGKKNKAPSKLPKESTLLHIAEILSVLASLQCGRQILLYGESKERLQTNKSAPMHSIVEFAKKSLSHSLSTSLGPPPSRAVVGAYVFVCRQLYSNCEGLHVLYHYGLHTYIADAWKEAKEECERAPTPTPDTEGDTTSQSGNKQECVDAFAWEQMLVDNLLNFAGTPKGLLLLQQTGAINECVEYMYVRYAKKLQVSRHEKFGYGTMVTQVAATAPGMVALQSTGFIKALLTVLWSVLECSQDERRIVRPTSTPIDAVDRAAHKSFMNLINVLSAYPAVYEVIADQQLSERDSYSFREIPTTITGIIERLIMVNTPGKIHSLFNVEQSHVFGLRILSIMCCCLDSLLLLETQYKILDMLLQGQQLNRREEGSNEFIIDMVSVENNHILVRTHVVGGPSERILPPRMLNNGDDPYPWPLFSQFPVPKKYTPSLTRPSAMKQENELSKFLISSRNEDVNSLWLDKCRKAFCSLLTRKADLATGKVLVDMLERVVAAQLKNPDESIFPQKNFNATDSQLKAHKLPDVQISGIRMAVRYGLHLKILNNNNESNEKLTMLLKQCRHYLRQQQQQRTVNSDIRFLQQDYMGHDWFASTLFLMCSGNRDKSWNLLHKFSSLVASGYLWLPRLHKSALVPRHLTSSGISPLFSTTGHNIELLLQMEVPLAFSALKMCGYTPSQICLHWLRQCFWNYLDWQDICHYICVCVLMGIDYQVYMCVAIFRYLQQNILTHAQNRNLQVYFKEEPIRGFQVGAHLEYMQQLEQNYRQLILTDMKNITKP